ncbi:GatB/YqeY domain-containing protein [Patescibacteria group bacterium]|nr:GatB/YqeY domain-containing protein [Patescibacteria group bacterium]
MSMKQQINDDLIAAMKDNDSIRKDALRMLKNSIMKFEVSGKDKVATDEIVMDLIQKEVKQRKDSITQFKDGGRDDLAEKEMKELEVLEKYMPEQMGEDEVREIVKQTVAEVGASGPADMGKVMGAIMPKVKGKADGGMVNNLVRESLN